MQGHKEQRQVMDKYLENKGNWYFSTLLTSCPPSPPPHNSHTRFVFWSKHRIWSLDEDDYTKRKLPTLWTIQKLKVGGGPSNIWKDFIQLLITWNAFLKEKVLLYSLVLLLNWIRKHVSWQNLTLRKMPIIIPKCKFLRPPEPDYVWHRIIS